MSGICTKLFTMRSILLEASSATPPFGSHIPTDGDKEQLDKAVEASRRILHNPLEELAWTTWKRPQVCPVDELLLMVMWPIFRVGGIYIYIVWVRKWRHGLWVMSCFPSGQRPYGFERRMNEQRMPTTNTDLLSDVCTTIIVPIGRAIIG